MKASYGNFTTAANRLDIVDPKEDLIQTWAANYGEFRSPHICPWAVPYTMMLPGRSTSCTAPKQMGGPIQRVRGLAVHTTWSAPGYSEVATVGHLHQDMERRRTPRRVRISSSAEEGTLVQVIPTNRIAYAQGGNGDPFWVSVEIQTKESPANAQQIQSANILFQWVCNSLNVPRKLASGYVGKASENPNNLYAPDAKRS